MEIGSFIELQFTRKSEYYSENTVKEKNIIRLNTGRAAIYHAFRCLKCESIYLPYYQCETVRDFLIKHGVDVKYYFIDKNFEPMLKKNEEKTAMVIVNYYGIMSDSRMKNLAENYCNVIIDNSQAFYAKPLENCLNVYSARKFVGVPDGAYVIGNSACQYDDEYKQDYSSDTSLFLLQRIEYGCEGKAYKSREENEKRLDCSDVRKMSKLTQTILCSVEYEAYKKIRRENFETAKRMFEKLNLLDLERYWDKECVPMVYPLLTEDENIMEKLLKKKHFQGRWWSYLTSECPKESMEYHLSKYMIPLTIDQRYGAKELEYIREVIES